MRFKPPKFLRKIAPALVWDIPARSGEVFLTFDDGPTPGVTEWILRELARFDAQATFFCLGRNVELYPDLYRMIVDAGHKVGNHTYSHLNGWGTEPGRYVEDVDLADRELHTELFRPPYGRISPRGAELLAPRYRIVMWNIISRDYSRRISGRTCLENVTLHLREGDIVVFHDSEKALRNLHFALPRTLKFLQDNGLKSRSIEI